MDDHLQAKRHAASACEDAGKPRRPHPFCRPPFPACEAAQLIATELFRAEQRWRCERRKQCTCDDVTIFPDEKRPAPPHLRRAMPEQ
ncbi:hypothetical protein BMJ32_03085 [Sinorhizobium medicae]|nr:hypothetical protein BMJ32_03085 [Sinorhizobium medicae]PLU42710.1 hypothetical protein BMJ25_28365 [Sinorhizobium medicae]PLU55016.1 hypothetical protein BMJ23_18825 [Sinorhizobium medicae]PLU71065.1 hypothetical protein BMJ21_11500 [Sinorhizobium medicae]